MKTQFDTQLEVTLGTSRAAFETLDSSWPVELVSPKKYKYTRGHTATMGPQYVGASPKFPFTIVNTGSDQLMLTLQFVPGDYGNTFTRWYFGSYDSGGYSGNPLYYTQTWSPTSPFHVWVYINYNRPSTPSIITNVSTVKLWNNSVASGHLLAELSIESIITWQ